MFATAHRLAEVGFQHLAESGDRVSTGGVEFHQSLNHDRINGINLDRPLALVLKENVITVDWTDEVIEGTALTNDGKLSKPPEKPAKPTRPAVKPVAAIKPAAPTPTKAA